jgi:hypothetical protein
MILRTCVQVGLLVALLAAPAAAGPPMCGGQDQSCCPGDSCNAADLECVCAAAGCTCVPCGADGQPCCDEQCANSGLACVGGTCGTCGGPGLDCCPGSPVVPKIPFAAARSAFSAGEKLGSPVAMTIRKTNAVKDSFAAVRSAKLAATLDCNAAATTRARRRERASMAPVSRAPRRQSAPRRQRAAAAWC